MKISLNVNIVTDIMPDSAGKKTLDIWWKKYTKNQSKWVEIKTNLPQYKILVTRVEELSGEIQHAFLHYQLPDTEGKFVGFITLDQDGEFQNTILEDTKFGIWTPTSYMTKEHRSTGLGGSLYRWALNSGFVLATDLDQTKYSNALWQRLAQEYAYLVYADDDLFIESLNDRKGLPASEQTLKQFSNPDFRMILFGKPWSQEQVNTWAKTNRFLK